MYTDIHTITNTHTCVFIHIQRDTYMYIYLFTSTVYIHAIHTWYTNMIYIHGIQTWYTYMVYIHDIHTYMHPSTHTYMHTNILYLSKPLYNSNTKQTQYDCNPPPPPTGGAGVTYPYGTAPPCTSSSKPSPLRGGTYIEYKHTTTTTPFPHPQGGAGVTNIPVGQSLHTHDPPDHDHHGGEGGVAGIYECNVCVLSIWQTLPVYRTNTSKSSFRHNSISFFSEKQVPFFNTI